MVKNVIGRAYREMMLALQFVTTLPTARLAHVTEQELQNSVVWFPALGAMLGIVLALTVSVLHTVFPPWPTAVIAIAMYTLLTGALHIDGLMDTADAIGSRAQRDRALEIMRDSRIGAMGAVAGCLLLIGKVTAIGSLPIVHIGLLIAVPTISRAAMVWSMTISPSARGNEGLAGMYAQKIPRKSVWITASFAGLVSVVTLGWILGIVLVISAAVFTLLFTMWIRKRFGGMTGDTYGAVNELVELVGFLLITAIC